MIELFSKRQKKLNGEAPDVYIYDKIPKQFRVQVIHIIFDAIGNPSEIYNESINEVYRTIHKALCREYGLFKLQKDASSDCEAISNFMLNADAVEKVLDVIELTFRLIKNYVSENVYRFHNCVKMNADDAIEELNSRFNEHAIGYRFESSEIIRIDSTFIHAEVTKPVLNLLSDKKYTGSNEEFLKAHEHYRHGRNKECLNECLKAFESTMKTICDKHKWSYNAGDTSKKLIEICLQNNLIPSYMQNQFASIRSLLESGTPTIRNKLGGHGQGSESVIVNDYLASYALNLTASNIMFLINADKTFR